MAKRTPEPEGSEPGPGFQPGLFRFLKDLKTHNDREWFQANKARFEAEARDPLLAFIAEFSDPLAGLSRHFEADPRPGFYLHLEPGASFAGGGLWHPEPATLHRLRTAIATKPKAWKAFKDLGLDLRGDALKRVPQGFPADHPFAEDLKFKDFYIGTEFSDAQVLAPDFMARFTQACRQAGPLVSFICKALDLPW